MEGGSGAIRRRTMRSQSEKTENCDTRVDLRQEFSG